MRAWTLPSPAAGLAAMSLVELPDPVPGKGEVLVRVERASLNPADRYLAEGQYPARPVYPHILGRDGVGRVVGVGPEVSRFEMGEEVLLLRSEVGVNQWGTFASVCIMPEESLVRPPAGWSMEECAAGPLVYLTAYQAITQWTDLPETGVVLISGASGGVGLASIHLSGALGMTPVALSRNAEKTGVLLAQGAATVLNPESPDWTSQLYKAHGKRPTVLAIDNIGGGLFPQMIDTLAQEGRVSCVGQLAGKVPAFSTASLFFRRIQMRGTSVGAYRPDDAQAAWGRIVDLLARTGRKPLVDSVYPLAKLPEAFGRLEKGPLGKVIVIPG